MNEEIKQNAAQALSEAFLKEYALLVQKFVKAGNGLDEDYLLCKLVDMSNPALVPKAESKARVTVYGTKSFYLRKNALEAAKNADTIYFEVGGMWMVEVAYKTIAKALKGKADKLYIENNLVFTRKNGEWSYEL